MSLLQQAQAHGIRLFLDGERIRYRAPAGVMTPERRDWLRRHRDTLRAELRARERAAVAEAVEERAAIQEHEGGLPRHQAEQEARAAMRVYRFRLTDTGGAWHSYIAPGCTLADATAELRARFGDRLSDIQPNEDHAP